jgi:hypothetical protein
MKEKIKWALSVSAISLIGYFKLNSMSVKKDLPEWKLAISKKRVLIVGTGPSLDKVDKTYFNKFDLIVYVNHAIKILGDRDSLFFTTDVGVLKVITEKEYFNNILSLGVAKSIVAPIFFQQSLFLDDEFKNRFTWISPNSAKYHISFKKVNIWKKLNFYFPMPPVFWPKQPDIHQLDQWFNSVDQVQSFPIVESTSALSAILFCAKYEPSSINLIGCDFGGGRAAALSSELHKHPEGFFDAAISKFSAIKEYLNGRGVVVENDSWNITR